MGIRTVIHQGKEVVIINWSKCKGIGDAIELLEQSAEFHRTSPQKIRTLDIFNGVVGSAPLLERARELNYASMASIKRERSAIVGASRLNRLLRTMFSQSSYEKLPVFKTVEEAMDYLGGN